MSYSPQLQFCSPKLYLHPLLKSNFTRPGNFQVFCSPSHHDSQRKERGKDECAVILVERYSNGTSKRYVMDNNERITTYLQERDNSELSRLQSSHGTDYELSWIPQIIKDFFLPAGFPGSVSDDYLDYILWQFPTNVTGWICHVLVTSSLLKAVGVGSVSGTTAAASAAAIRWVSKDGIGAVGRLLIGGRFGSLFDDDPKQWRMYADFIGSAGSIFDLCTPLYPGYFLPLASLGNLAKAVARGLKDPSFRVIQNHFAIAGNLGEVAAKEEVWEVSAQLIGLALGIYALDSSFISTSYPTLASTWLTMRLLHLWFRYMSLSVIQFDTINLKRARILVQSYISSTTVPGCKLCNSMENILLWQRFIRPSIVFSVSLEEMVGGQKNMIKMLLQLFAKESYVLMVNRQQLKHFEVLVTFKVGATSLSVLRSVWQSYWLHQNASNSVSDIKNIEQSLVELDDKFSDFIQRLKEAGWETKRLSLKIPMEIFIQDLILDNK